MAMKDFRAYVGHGRDQRGNALRKTLMRLQNPPPANHDKIETIPVKAETTMPNDTMTRIFGGSPLAVLGRLVLVSILVGVVLSTLGLDPFDIVQSLERLIQSIWNMGFDAFRWLWRYLLLGAVIVVPVWIVLRLINAPRGK
jgi:hypothetical protein